MAQIGTRRAALYTEEVPPVLPWKVAFYDSFTGTDGALLSARAPDINTFGAGWVATTKWALTGGRAAINAGGAANAVLDTARRNYRVTTKHRLTAFGGVNSVVVRAVTNTFSSVSGYFMVKLVAATSLATFQIQAMVAGSLKTYDSLPVEVGLNTDYEIKVAVMENMIWATLNGGARLFYPVVDIDTRPFVGLIASVTTALFDDFTVETID